MTHLTTQYIIYTATTTPTYKYICMHTGPALTDAVSTAQSKQNDHTWTIVGAVSSFTGGVVLGIIIMAVFYNRRNFLWNKYIPQRANDSGEKGGKIEVKAVLMVVRVVRVVMVVRGEGASTWGDKVGGGAEQ